MVDAAMPAYRAPWHHATTITVVDGAQYNGTLGRRNFSMTTAVV
jgi:hypothetical protein